MPEANRKYQINCQRSLPSVNRNGFWRALWLIVFICGVCNVVQCSPQISPATPEGTSVGSQAASGALATLPVFSPQVVNVIPVESAKNASISTTTTAPPKNLTTISEDKKLNATMPWEVETRLPRDVIPEHYDIMLRPNLTAGSFNGDVSIIVVLHKPRREIYFHVKYLSVSSVELLQLAPDAGNTTTVGARNVTIARRTLELKHQFLVLHFDEQTPAGRYALNMHFNGTMLDKIRGFYRSSYKDKNNQTRLLAASKLESTDARQMFPCFDEPSIKATFSMAVEHESSMTALSNMPVVERKQQIDSEKTSNATTNNVITRFAQTPPMVTYLVALIVCDFRFIETKSARGIPIRVYASPEQVDNGNLNFALEVTKFSLDLYEKYFDIPYQLPKLDVVAIPDFQAGAMENWGLMTFREIYLVYDPYEAPSSSKQQVALVISHELAHQWFGDLMTTEWWDSLWLNEGFATRMEFIGITGLDPEWPPVSDYFVAVEMQTAFAQDSLISSHPIVVAGLVDPAAIEEIFDNIPYAKGASCIRMLENLMGEETFRHGITRFLRAHMFSTANSDDLWRALQQQLSESGCGLSRNGATWPNEANHTSLTTTNSYGAGTQCFDVKQFMDTFILQMNFPVIHLESVNATHGRVRQERLLIDPSKANATSLYSSPFNYKWTVPVTYRILDEANRGKQGLFWLNDTHGTIEWASSSSSSSSSMPLIKLNPGEYGFYLVNYPLELWLRIADQLNANINFLPDASDRSGLIYNAFSLARASILPYTVPLSLLRYLKQERALSVWVTVTSAIDYVGSRLEAIPDAYWMFREFVRDLVRPALAELGWNDVGPFTQRILRGLLANLACEYGDVECLSTARHLFREWIFNGKRVPPNFRLVVYNHGMRQTGGEREWQFVFDQLKTTLSPQQKRLLYASLASSAQPWQLQRYMSLGWNETHVRRQDYFSIFTYMSANPIALPYVWDHVRANWPRLVQRFTLNDRYLGRVFPNLAAHFNEDLRLAEMKEFFARYPEGGAGKTQRLRAVETIQNNLQWLKQHNVTITKWLSEQVLVA